MQPTTLSQNKKIVIVEDEPILVSAYTKKFADEGFIVKAYATGKEGFDGICEIKPDCIILDIMLPGGMNGFDVLEQLKKHPELEHIPVLVLTNLDSEEETAKKIGALEYIIKTNISLDDVVKKVKSLLV